MFSQLGGVVLDADRIGHDVLDDEGVKSEIRDLWGLEVIDSDATINRKALASIVFDDQDEGKQLEILEGITHPRIKNRIQRRIEKERENGTSAVVLDAPLLFEAGWDSICDHLVFVKTPEKIRLQRVLQRGWTQEQLLDRESHQLDLTEKERRSHHVIDNSGDELSAFKQVERIWKLLEF